MMYIDIRDGKTYECLDRRDLKLKFKIPTKQITNYFNEIRGDRQL